MDEYTKQLIGSLIMQRNSALDALAQVQAQLNLIRAPAAPRPAPAETNPGEASSDEQQTEGEN